jgi:hypothetical protein
MTPADQSGASKMKSMIGLLIMIAGVLSGVAALICFIIVLVSSDIRTLGAGGSAGMTGDALAIIAGLAVAALLLWWGGRTLRRTARD